jgi:hypothetical protein
MHMTRIARRFILIAALALSACVGAYDGTPKFAGEATLPPLAPGLSRLFFYRPLEYYDVELGTTAYLNRQPVGFLRTGSILYRDMPPGSYFVSVLSRGAYPDQFKTVQIGAGQVWYFRIESLQSWSGCFGGADGCRGDTFTVNVMDPAIARLQTTGLALSSN